MSKKSDGIDIEQLKRVDFTREALPHESNGLTRVVIEQKIESFLAENIESIQNECIKHLDKVGYVTVLCDSDFKIPAGGMWFKEGDFTTDHFILRDYNFESIDVAEVSNSTYIYYLILFHSDKSKLMMKEIVLTDSNN